MFYITFGVISLSIKFNIVYSNIWISYIVNDYIIKFNKFQTQCSNIHIHFELLHQQVYFIVKRKMFNTYNKQTITNNTLTHFSKLIIHFSIFSNFLSPSLSTIFVVVSSLSSSFFILGPHFCSITFSLHHEKKLQPTTSSLPPYQTKQKTPIAKLGFPKPKYKNNIHQKNTTKFISISHTLNFGHPQNFLPLFLAVLPVLMIAFSPQ